MKLLLCLLLIGCTHKTIVVSQDPILIQDLEGCETDEAGRNYWIGVDGMIGIGNTCAEAYEDWRHSMKQPTQSRI